MLMVGSITGFVKLAAVFKDLFIAYSFGTSDALDAFLVALILPSFGVTLVAGSLNAALIPTYIHVWEHQGREAAQYLFSSVAALSTALLIALCVGLALLAPYIFNLLASGFTPGKLRLTSLLYYSLLPTLIFSGLSTTWGAILNARNRFALSAIAPITTSFATVVSLIFLNEAWGIYALSMGLVTGMLLEAGFLAWGLRREGLSPLPSWHGLTAEVRQVLDQLSPVVAGAFLTCSAVVISQSMAAMLGPGSVSAFSYGTKITIVVLSVSSLAVSTTVLPHFSRMAAAKNWHGVYGALVTYCRMIFIVTLPVTVALIYLSEPLVRLCFQRGAFTEADSHIVAQVQAMYLLHLPFYIAGMVVVRVISSLRINHLLMWGAVLSLTLSVLLNYVLMKWFAVPGLALATSLMYVASFCFLFLMTVKALKARRFKELSLAEPQLS
jgi:putative peptidoglycan lipid II flippase